MCKLILEHYRFIKKMNDMSIEELGQYIYGVNPSIYSAFKNNELKCAKNIISDYLSIIKSSLNIIKHSIQRSEKETKAALTRVEKIIKALYINKKQSPISEIEEELGINKSHFCRYHIGALKYFAAIFNKVAQRKGYPNALSNIDTRILAIMRLDKQAKTVKQSA